MLQADSAPPEWRLAQWGTKFSLKGAEQRTDGATRSVENEAKRVTIHPGGLAGEGLTLLALGGVEYGGALREQGEPWPHLLIEQSFPDGVRLADYDALRFALDFRVIRSEVDPNLPVIQHLHTGHITAFFAIRNGNRQSEDFRDMIWFGLPLFDARFELPRGHQAVDGGKADATGKFIYSLPGERFYDTPTGDGEWHGLRAELLPLVEEALAAAQSNGFLTETQFNDLRVSSFNLGWELPGPYDCEITVKELSLRGARVG